MAFFSIIKFLPKSLKSFSLNKEALMEKPGDKPGLPIFYPFALDFTFDLTGSVFFVSVVKVEASLMAS